MFQARGSTSWTWRVLCCCCCLSCAMPLCSPFRTQIWFSGSVAHYSHPSMWQIWGLYHIIPSQPKFFPSMASQILQHPWHQDFDLPLGPQEIAVRNYWPNPIALLSWSASLGVFLTACSMWLGLAIGHLGTRGVTARHPTRQGKIHYFYPCIFELIFKKECFHCYVSLPEGMAHRAKPNWHNHRNLTQINGQASALQNRRVDLCGWTSPLAIGWTC